jgi:hypothetical protein
LSIIARARSFRGFSLIAAVEVAVGARAAHLIEYRETQPFSRGNFNKRNFAKRNFEATRIRKARPTELHAFIRLSHREQPLLAVSSVSAKTGTSIDTVY